MLLRHILTSGTTELVSVVHSLTHQHELLFTSVWTLFLELEFKIFNELYIYTYGGVDVYGRVCMEYISVSIAIRLQSLQTLSTYAVTQPAYPHDGPFV